MVLSSSLLLASSTAGWHGTAGTQFPSAATTGVPPGTNLTTVGTGAGQVSSGPGWTLQTSGGQTFVKITGQGSTLTKFQNFYVPLNVTVRAPNVLIQNCLITPPVNKDGIDVANIAGGTPPTPSSNVTIDHCTITSQSPVSAQPVAFTATSASPCVFSAPGTAYSVGTQIILSGSSLPQGFGDLTTFGFTAATSGVFTAAGTNYLSGQPITIAPVSGTTFPTGISPGTYYVINPGISGSGTFQLSTTPTGAFIPITGAGGGNINPPWYVIASMVTATTFTLAYNVFPSTPLASGSTGSGNVQQMNTAWTGLCGIKDVNGDTLGLVITACDVSNMTSGIQCEQGLVQANYLHDMNYINPPGPGGSHINGFSSGGNTSTWETDPNVLRLTVKGNTSLNPWTQSDAIALFQDAAQQIHRVLDGNLVAGAGFAMTCGFGGALKQPQPIPTDIVIQNNRFSTKYYPNSGQFGPEDGWTTAMSADQSNIWQNNAFYESGAVITPPGR